MMLREYIFTEQEIKVSTVCGQQTVKAMVNGFVAIHETLGPRKGEWTITHVPTGYIMLNKPTVLAARRAAIKIIELEVPLRVMQCVDIANYHPAYRALAELIYNEMGFSLEIIEEKMGQWQ